MRMRRSTWFYSAIILVGPSCSFEAHPAVRRCSLHRHRFASNSDVNDAESDADITHQHLLQQLLIKAELNPDHCLVERLSGPGFCNALYKIQCGEDRQVSAEAAAIENVKVGSSPPLLITLIPNRWLQSCFQV